MRSDPTHTGPRAARGGTRFGALLLAAGLLGAGACATSVDTTAERETAPPVSAVEVAPMTDVRAPDPDPRVGLEPGLFDAGEAAWNMRLVSSTPPPEDYVGVTNSDLAFQDRYAIQGNYNGILIWDISSPESPQLVSETLCPASQNDVSVYGDLLFVSAEAFNGRLDCGTEGIQERASPMRIRGIRIFDISDIRNPEYIANVQTCRGSHTHSLLVDPDDDENVYVYISGSAPVRPAEELEGCSPAPPEEDPESALFRIEVIQVPLANPTEARIVSSPRIFEDLVEPPQHGPSAADLQAIEEARAQGAFVVEVQGNPVVLPPQFIGPRLDSIVEARGGAGEPTAADSAALREALPGMIDRLIAAQQGGADPEDAGPRPGPTQCHDITLYPEMGIGGGACEGYGLLLDITDPTNPVRLDAVADSNFAYWHSATFNNEATTVVFTDEWGGGGGAKCRELDPMEWGADAIFAIEDGELVFQSYFKMPAPQTELENCVAHNGSIIPVPGRDIMVQAWYQGGISVFDFTDPANPVEIAFFDRGPTNPDRMGSGGSWSVYWYNGSIVSSEIARGLDILELVPNPWLTENEIEAARTVRMERFNAQGQPYVEWPATFAVARAYVDQLDRSNGLSDARIAEVRRELAAAERRSGAERRASLTGLADALSSEAARSSDADKVRTLADTLRELAAEE